MSAFKLPLVVVDQGATFVETGDANEATSIRAAFAAQWNYIQGRVDEGVLDDWRDRALAGCVVETDRDVLDELGRRGEFDLAEVYRELFG